MNEAQITNIITAFSSGTAGIRRQCHCGTEYYSTQPADVGCFDEGELEALEADPKAIGVDQSVGTLIVNGVEYVDECKCWHSKLAEMTGFLHAHRSGIIRWFHLDKQRRQAAVDRLEDPEGE